MKKYLIVFIVFVCIIFSGCSVQQKTGLIKLSPLSYPDFIDDMSYKDLDCGISQSLKYLNRVPCTRIFQFGEDSFNASHMIRSLEVFSNFIKTNPSSKALKKFIKSNYIVYKSSGDAKSGRVLFTGYYEPLLKGSLYETLEYKYPVYGPPNDLSIINLSDFSSKFKGQKIIGRVEGKTFIPYHDRKEIENDKVLKGKAEILAWVKDPIALFFLHIQGSGRIALDNGKTISVNYNSKNGRPYKSIGKLLIDENKISRSLMSMQKIRQYLLEHPEEMDRILNYNPSYIFFAVKEDGPFGAINVPLTPERSIAVDPRIFPLSTLAFIQVQKPVVDNNDKTKILQWKNFSRFMLNQDTGGAIKGPGRTDIFWGHGQYAETAAGHMKHRGNLYLLVLKPVKTDS